MSDVITMLHRSEPMNRNRHLAAVFLLALVGGINACTGMRAGPPPPYPDQPRPLSSFGVEFVPAGSERYPSTETSDVVRFRNVLQYPGESERVLSETGKPTRPYVKIGEVKFGLNWYYSSNIRELINTHVPRVGGDAVLVYHAYPGGAVAMNFKRGEQVYYQS